VFEAGGPGLEVRSDIDILPGFVGQIVDQPAENVKIFEILLPPGVEKGEGSIEGALPNFGPGLFKADVIEWRENLLCQLGSYSSKQDIVFMTARR
jgi:hypothetical protein